ncbi:MAG TPA: VWA domain-containing protein [Bryobacteraceae bacterium]|jgi:VWFA-related protein|nr:VWA domain-containing protein [Bryobacteraceae bacterium]
MALSGIRSIQIAGFLACFAGFGGVVAYGQASGPQPNLAVIPRASAAAEKLPASTFRLDVRLIQVPVQVTDLRDRPVLGLPKSGFRLFEDDVEQQISSFSMTDAPISTGLVFDASRSMRDRIGESRAAVDHFCETSLPADEFFLVKFSDSAELISPFTRDTGEIQRQLSSVRPHGWTAMIDAIWRSVVEMRRATNPRRVLLVLSDGGDNNSRYSEGELLSLVREADVRIYAIGLFQRPRFLEKLADETGGSVIWVHKMGDLPEAMETLSLQIRNEYVVGYFPNHPPNDGKYHKVRVEVQPPAGLKQVHASWRRGYIEP